MTICIVALVLLLSEAESEAWEIIQNGIASHSQDSIDTKFSLAELECETLELKHHMRLKSLTLSSIDASMAHVAAIGQASGPSDELMQEADRILAESQSSESQILYSMFVQGPTKDNAFPFASFCLFGLFTALYVRAWEMAANSQIRYSLFFLEKTVKLLRMNDLDLLHHTRWPISSWDVQCNMEALRRGASFYPKWEQPHLGADRPRLPRSWPPFSPQCWPGVDGFCNQLVSRRKQLTVWFTSKHPGPFTDIAAAFANYLDERYEVQILGNVVGEHCQYAIYNDLCSKDPTFSEAVLRQSYVISHQSTRACGEERGQNCGLRELHADFDNVTDIFHNLFGARVSKEVDIFVCGHPLYWCRLFDRYDLPILGVWDLSHQFTVPRHMQIRWNREFLSMFQKPHNLLVASGAFLSFLVHWLLGIQAPYFQRITLNVAANARYTPVHENSILISIFQRPYHIEFLKRFALAVPGFPFKLQSWVEDLPCGGTCPKSELARYRAVIVDCYDTNNLKFSEFYAMAMPMFIDGSALYRTTMRWSYASALEGGPNASISGHEPLPLPGPNGWTTIISREIARAKWNEPWQLEQRSNCTPSIRPDGRHFHWKQVVGHYLAGMAVETLPVDLEIAKRQCLRLESRCGGVTCDGDDGTSCTPREGRLPKVSPNPENEEVSYVLAAGLARDSNEASRNDDSCGWSFPFTPFTIDREYLHPAGAYLWSMVTDWSMWPHVVRTTSASDMFEKLMKFSQAELIGISTKMAIEHQRMVAASVNFWRAVVISLVEHKDASHWRR